jgi:diaminopropionate ammonia-lyase
VNAFVNPAYDPLLVERPVDDAASFHRSLEGYAPTPVRALDSAATDLGLAAVGLKDESSRLGLPAFKILGASWALECALRASPDTHTVVAASAGNHGRAVANAASRRGLRARIFLPARSLPARRDAIAGEGAEVVVIDGTYEDAVAGAVAEGREPGVLEIADVGTSEPAHRVIDGYATLFDETLEQGSFDVILVPVGVGSLAAAAARFGARHGVYVVGVEPVNAACLTASLAAGRPTAIEAPGTVMAGLDCAEISPSAWESLRAGIRGTVTVTDEEAEAAVTELAAGSLAIGHSGAATLAALRKLAARDDTAELRAAIGLSRASRVLLIATEGRTDLPAGAP